MPVKVSEVVKLLEHDRWTLERTSGSHRHHSHPSMQIRALAARGG